MKLISDKELIKIPIKDNGERMVYVKDFCPEIVIRLGAYIKKEGKKSSKDASLVREGAAKRLKIAQNNLPKGYRLMLRCGYRSLSIQKKRYNWAYNNLKKKHPDWSRKKLKEETNKRVAPIGIVPPHSTGGTVDVSVISPKKKQLNMGTKLGTFNEKTSTYSNKISKSAKKNRKILISAMKKAGFVNYPTEWWHWSYGDRYWAATLRKRYSIYKGL
jgi:D-alanyl-D-alanine dipeptidase